MRPFIIASLLVGGMCVANPLSAQQTVSSVSSVRLVFQKVDQVALDFGVDTAAMRRRAVQRLGAAGIAVVQDPTQPELAIAVRVPKQLAPVDHGTLVVDMRLLEPTSPASPNPRRVLWNASAPATRFTIFGSLRELIPEQLERRFDAFTAARSGT